ncbi:uncharacterized protein LOC135087525 isoform X4 [Ostrinia nubilalis]|uniref:uncharacterized protein LOC135087525 isoform X4 n=1 Tax=Ostrinia nubilalis TaxID=29057 RepID=UPI0030823A82
MGTASSGEQDSACLPLYLKCDSSIARNTWTEECGTYAVPRCRRRLMANESNPPTTRLVTGNDPGASSCRQIWWCVNEQCVLLVLVLVVWRACGAGGRSLSAAAAAAAAAAGGLRRPLAVVGRILS